MHILQISRSQKPTIIILCIKGWDKEPSYDHFLLLWLCFLLLLSLCALSEFSALADHNQLSSDW